MSKQMIRERDKPTECDTRFRADGRLQIDVYCGQDSIKGEPIGDIVWDGPIDEPLEIKPAMMLWMLNNSGPGGSLCQIEMAAEDALELAHKIIAECTIKEYYE